MGKSVFKDLIREIKGSLGRFISIMAITAIGAAFFAGVTASSGDMKRSSDNYYDEYNMNDLRIIFAGNCKSAGSKGSIWCQQQRCAHQL